MSPLLSGCFVLTIKAYPDLDWPYTVPPARNVYLNRVSVGGAAACSIWDTDIPIATVLEIVAWAAERGIPVEQFPPDNLADGFVWPEGYGGILLNPKPTNPLTMPSGKHDVKRYGEQVGKSVARVCGKDVDWGD